MTEREHLISARKVADAILYEGYLLYPYRQTSQKNQSRFQFGVLMPPAYRAVDPSEECSFRAECLAECGDDAEVIVDIRFLQVQRRRVFKPGASGDPREPAMTEVSALRIDEIDYTSWDEAVQREHRVQARVSQILEQDLSATMHSAAGQHASDITDSAGVVAGHVLRE